MKFYELVALMGSKVPFKYDPSVLIQISYMKNPNSSFLSKAWSRKNLYFRVFEEVLDKKVGKLSAGWQRRVLLAKLLCCPATIWLLDEPTNNLDKLGKELLFNLINVRVKEGGIVIAATHDEMLFNLGSKFYLEDFIA